METVSFFDMTEGREEILILPEQSILTEIVNYSASVSRSMGQIANTVRLRGKTFYRFPASAETIFGVEALVKTFECTATYRDFRNSVMESTPGEKQAWAEVSEGLDLGVDLLPHQITYCEKTLSKDISINASEQGTGKTIMSLALFRAWAELPQSQNVFRLAIVVCPLSIVSQWAEEIEKIYKLDKEFISASDGLYIISAEWITIIVTNYEKVKKIQPLVSKFTSQGHIYLVFDESWKVKNLDSQISKDCIQLQHNAKKIIICNGTIFGQDIMDFWGALAFVGIRGRSKKDYYDFMNTYAVVTPQNIGSRVITKIAGVKNRTGLMQMVKEVYYRATKATCLNLPLPMEPVVIPFVLPLTARKIYNKIRAEGGDQVINQDSTGNAAVGMIRRHQICGGFLALNNTPDEFATSTGIEEEIVRVQMEAASFPGPYVFTPLQCSKYAWTMDFIRDRLSLDPVSRMIIWCTYKDEVRRYTELLNRDRRRAIIHTGEGILASTDLGITSNWKERYNDKNPEGANIIVCTTASLAYGLNLQGTDINIFHSNNWSAVMKSQALARSHRFGRIGPVAIYELVTTNTVDTEILKALNEKRDFEASMSIDTTQL